MVDLAKKRNMLRTFSAGREAVLMRPVLLLDVLAYECGVAHDRDINAARNILALGHERPSWGIPVL